MVYRYKNQTWTDEEVMAMVLGSVVESTKCGNCGHSWRVEPDASNYTCHECKKGEVHSPLVALGIA